MAEPLIAIAKYLTQRALTDKSGTANSGKNMLMNGIANALFQR